MEYKKRLELVKVYRFNSQKIEVCKTWQAVSELLRSIRVSSDMKERLKAYYAVNDDEPVIVRDSFLQPLNDEIFKVGTSRELVSLGEFSSRTGMKENNKVEGRHGKDTVNNNGEGLISTCEQYNTNILNGYFQYREIHEYTWRQET